MAKKKKSLPGTIRNRRAGFDYDIKDQYYAGIILTGPETSSLRRRHGHLQGAYITINNGVVQLINATIMPMQTNRAHFSEDQVTRARTLLLNKREIDELQAAKQQGLTIVPLAFFTDKKHIKLQIAVGRGKKKYDKRSTIKARDQERDAKRSIAAL